LRCRVGVLVEALVHAVGEVGPEVFGVAGEALAQRRRGLDALCRRRGACRSGTCGWRFLSPWCSRLVSRGARWPGCPSRLLRRRRPAQDKGKQPHGEAAVDGLLLGLILYFSSLKG
jgi:hypothetical protein